MCPNASAAVTGRRKRAGAMRAGQKHLHRAGLRELSRCRHAALDRILLLPTETYVGDPEQCSRMDDSPDDPGISNAWDSSDSYGASGGGSSRGA